MSLNDIAKSEKNTPTKSVITFFFRYNTLIEVVHFYSIYYKARRSLFFADFYMYPIKKYVNRKKYLAVT